MNVHTMNKFIFTLAFLFTLLSVSQARTTLTASQPYGLRGEVVQVEVHYSSDSSEVVGAQFTLEYDPAQMTVGEVLEGNASADHELFDEQETGKISLTLLSMTNKAFSAGTLASISFTLDADLSQETPAVTLLPEETLLVTKAGEKESYEAIQKINDLFLKYAAEGVASKPSVSRSLSFSAEDDGSDTSYQWDFGDGTVKSGKEATHVYKTPDSYLITITASNFLGSKESTRRITVNAPYWALDADELGNGWKSFDWFGAFYQTTDSPWIFHQNLGWLYRHGETVDDTWLWSDLWNWGWTSDQTFPYLAKSTGDWLYFLPGSHNPARLYDYGVSQWLAGY